MASDSNRDVVYLERGGVEVQKIDFPTFRNPAGKTIDHGVILKVVTTNICGSDQHMVRGRTTAPAGIAVAVAVFGALSLLIVDHGLWNRPYVESSRAHAATEAAAKADGALITPTRKLSLYSRIVRRLR
jgi:hypothetical protein